MDMVTWLTTQLEIKNMNAQGLSHAIGVSHVTVGKWLRGTYTPDPENCRKLAEYFQMPEQEVMIIAGHLTPFTENTLEVSPYYTTNQHSPELTNAIQMFVQLDEEDQARVLSIMRTFLREQQHSEKEA